MDIVTNIAGLRIAAAADAIQVLGYYSPADGGGGVYAYSPTVAADNGGTVIAAADGGSWRLCHQGAVDARQFGAVMMATVDNAGVLNKALAAAGVSEVRVPPGCGLIRSMVTVPNGKRLVGFGVTTSRLIIDQLFDISAEAVIRLGTSEAVTFIDGIGLEFYQPASSLRSDMIQYPWAISHADCPRVCIGHVRLSRAWNGINAYGNCGGSKYDFIESGCLNVGLAIDGSFDTFNLGIFRSWPFGMPDMESGPGAVYVDGGATAATIGRCDGLAGEIQSFRARVDFVAGLSGTGSASPSRRLASVHLDGDGAVLRATSGPASIGHLYTTKSPLSTQSSSLVVSGDARVRIDSMDAVDDSTINATIRVTGGSLDIGGGRIRRLGADKNAILQTGGKLTINNTELVAEGARTAPYVRVTAGEFNSGDCHFPENGGTGVGIAIEGAAVTGGIHGLTPAGRRVEVNAAAMVGNVGLEFGGFFSADAVGMVVIPDGWSVSRVSTGVYRITHGLNWSTGRTQVNCTSRQASGPAAEYTINATNSTQMMTEIRCFIGGVLADAATAFSIEHT